MLSFLIFDLGFFFPQSNVFRADYFAKLHAGFKLDVVHIVHIQSAINGARLRFPLQIKSILSAYGT